MSGDLDALLDECIDRINRGESIEECLAGYPEHAVELEPLLRAVLDIRDACSPIPSLAAKAEARRRLDAALAAQREVPKHRRALVPLFGRPRAQAFALVLSVLAIIGIVAWALIPPGGPGPVVAQANFRLLISDEANAIDDFESLEVTISSIWVHRAGESGGWEIIELDEPVTVDLTDLQGLNAAVIWEGELEPGEYTKVFIYTASVNGTLEGGATAIVELPSDKLQISKPFAITADGSPVNFVFDITVVQAGEKYNLSPQAMESGPGQPFHEMMGEGDLILQVVDGDVTPGESITVLVTSEGDPVPGATVTVNDEVVGTTGEDGSISFEVPDAEELEIKAVLDDLEGELEINLQTN